MLDDRRRRSKEPLHNVTALSGNANAYEPAEECYSNTRRYLEVLPKYHYAVIISAKSTLILRDLDTLSQVARDIRCAIGVTITTLDRKLAGFLEPRAPLPERRLNVIKEIKQRRPEIQAGVNFIPIVPFLSDDEKNMEEVVAGTKNAGADFILFGGGMTLRDNASCFMRTLSEEFPHLVDKYERLYQAKYAPAKGYRGRYEPGKSYFKRIHRKTLDLCDRHQLAFRLKRHIPEDFRKQNHLVAQKLLHESYLSQMSARPWTKTF